MRLYFSLALISLAGLVASLCWAAAIALGYTAVGPHWQFPIFILPLAIFGYSYRTRSDAEMALMGAALGLHRSNYRPALKTCFAPYRRRKLLAWVRRLPRVALLGFIVLAAIPASGLILPLVFANAFLMSLRRAAWLGYPDAILLEWDWLRVRGPILTPAGRQLAAMARAR